MSGEDISNALNSVGSLTDVMTLLIIVSAVVSVLFFGTRNKARSEFSKAKKVTTGDAVNGQVVKLVGQLRYVAPSISPLGQPTGQDPTSRMVHDQPAITTSIRTQLVV